MTIQNMPSWHDKDKMLKETINELNSITDGIPLSVTGEVSISPVQYNPETQFMDACEEQDADKFGVYVQVKGRHKGVDYLEWYWLADFRTRKEAWAYSEFVKTLLPAYYFISDCVGSTKAFFETNSIETVLVIDGTMPSDAPAGAVEFDFNGRVYTCLNAEDF